ncbi:MAG: hypothetical protein GY866_15855 [Proteobacteria bacterium]|nr:hypothetical protein [Pseudomonadota bacterium]
MRNRIIMVLMVVSLSFGGSLVTGCSGSGGKSGAGRSGDIASRKSNKCRTTKPSARGPLSIVKCGFR